MPHPRRPYPQLPPRSHRTIWWVQLILVPAVFGVPALVWWLAGGTIDPGQAFADGLTTRPALAGLATMVALLVVATLTGYESRTVERQHLARWYALRHPDHSPDVAQVTDAVEQILWLHGPQRPFALLSYLAAGGRWGRPLPVSRSALGRILRCADTDLTPALAADEPGPDLPWLVRRTEFGEPYSHVDNPYRPDPTTADPADARRLSLRERVTVRVEHRRTLESLVRQCGPLDWEQLHGKLTAGGPWGPPMPTTRSVLAKLLKEPGSDAPVRWLAPRAHGDLYNHIDNIVVGADRPAGQDRT